MTCSITEWYYVTAAAVVSKETWAAQLTQFNEHIVDHSGNLTNLILCRNFTFGTQSYVDV